MQTEVKKKLLAFNKNVTYVSLLYSECLIL